MLTWSRVNGNSSCSGSKVVCASEEALTDMPKKVIYLVKTLGAKSYDQVVDWLRAVGYDVSADGFGPLAEIDDKTISKLKDVASGKVEVEGPAKRIRRASVEEDVDFVMDVFLNGVKA